MFHFRWSRVFPWPSSWGHRSGLAADPTTAKLSRLNDYLQPTQTGKKFPFQVRPVFPKFLEYRKDTEPLYNSLGTHLYHTFFRYLSITCNAFIACYIRCKKYLIEVILVATVSHFKVVKTLRTCKLYLVWNKQMKRLLI